MLGAAAAGYITYQRIKDTYYVAEENSQIKVMNGTDASVLGIKLNSVKQDICLEDDGTAKLVDPGAGDDCHLFTTSDLTPAARGALEDLPEDSYEKVESQVNRLAEQTLPVCVTRVPSDKESKKDDRNDSERRSGGDPADLTTPGVSCREVK